MATVRPVNAEQLGLFGERPGLVRADHPDTAQHAALRVTPRTGTQRRRVLDYLIRSGGATDEEIQTGLGMAGNTERPRRVELVGAGYVIDSGVRRRVGDRYAIVWRAS